MKISRRNFHRLAGFGALSLAADMSVGAPRFGPPSADRQRPVVRLNSNENPHGPSPAALAAIRDSFTLLNRYPDEQEERLISDIARLHSLSEEQVLLGNGSSELLKFAALAFTSPNHPLVLAKPTFEAIRGHAAVSGAAVHEVTLTSDHRHHLDGMRAIKGAGLIYICNPNNPTASITPKEELRGFFTAVSEPTVIVVDEAYHHYVESPRYESAIPLMAKHPNLVVMRTFSKIYGMAGLRCGYAVGQREVIERMRRHQPWNNTNLPALVAARASLADTAHLERHRRLNSEARQELVRLLHELGYQTIPSEANFVMAHLGREVRPVITALREQKVHVGRVFPALPNHLRISIGTPEEMAKFLQALREVTAERKRAA